MVYNIIHLDGEGREPGCVNAPGIAGQKQIKMKRYTVYYYKAEERWYVFDNQTNCLVGGTESIVKSEAEIKANSMNLQIERRANNNLVKTTNPAGFAQMQIYRILLAKQKDGFYIGIQESEAKSILYEIIVDIIDRCGDDGFLRDVAIFLKK